MNTLILKVLRRHISPLQLIGFTLANFIGMTILLVGIQFYQDAMNMLRASERFASGNYLVLSKPVSTLGMFVGTDNSFGERELKDLKAQPFVKDMGAFVPSKFRVVAGIDIGVEMYTYMFFESVPNRFLDVDIQEWQYSQGSETIPIILPRAYLSLYNAAFSQSQGLPQISENSMKMISLSIKIGSDEYQGRIVGFSDRLNTLLVPEDFLLWANDRYASGDTPRPTRLIIEVDELSSEKLLTYIKSNDYQVEGNAIEQGRTAWILRIIASIISIIGLIISALSLYLLILSIYLLLQRNTESINHLLMMGYTRRRIVLPYWTLVIILNTLVWFGAIFTTLLIRSYYLEYIQQTLPGGKETDITLMLLIALMLALTSMTISAIAITRRVYTIPAFAR